MRLKLKISIEMAGSGLIKACRLLILHLLFCSLLSTVLSQSDDPDPQCTQDRKGLPACNFNTRNCWNEPKDGEGAWSHVKVGDQGQYQGPVKPIEKGYVYVDPSISQGQPKKLTGQISTGKEAICVKFYYATTGNSSAPITFYIQKGNVYSPVHRVEANTGGMWLETNFSCCLPDVKKTKLVAIEAASTADEIVAIDYVDVSRSNMSCTGDELVCYPTLEEKTTVKPQEEETTTAPPKGQSSGEPPKGQICASDKMHSGVPSCDFNSADTCGWLEWTGMDTESNRTRPDLYDDISYVDNTTHAVLVADIDDDVESICMEVQFKVLTTQTHLGNIFAIYIKTQNETHLWGEAYNYEDGKQKDSKINRFQSRLPAGTDRQILLIYQKEKLTLDSIHVKTSELPPAPTKDVPQIDVKRIKTLFTCPLNSGSTLLPPLCGMVSVPDEEWSDDLGWTGDENSEFPGKDGYLLYRGSGENIRDKGASLTKSDLNSATGVSILSFSYALSGRATLEVHAVDEKNSENLLWSSAHETARIWVEVKDIYVEKTGNFKIVFKIVPLEITTDSLVYVGLTDIEVASSEKKPAAENSTPVKTDSSDKDTTSTSQSGGPSSNTGVIVGAVLGALLGVALIGGAVYWFFFRDRDESEEKGQYIVTMQNGASKESNIENAAYSP